jgi:hypothetical protein
MSVFLTNTSDYTFRGSSIRGYSIQQVKGLYLNSGAVFYDDFIQSLIFGTILFFHLFDNLKSIK